MRKVQNLEGREVISSQELFEPYLVVVPEPDGEEQHEYDGYPDEGGQEEQEQDGGAGQYQGLQQHPPSSSVADTVSSGPDPTSQNRPDTTTLTNHYGIKKINFKKCHFLQNIFIKLIFL